MAIVVTEIYEAQKYGQRRTSGKGTYTATRTYTVEGVIGAREAYYATGLPSIGDLYVDERTDPLVTPSKLYCDSIDANVSGRDDVYIVTCGYTYSNNNKSNSSEGTAETPTPLNPVEGNESWNISPKGGGIRVMDCISQDNRYKGTNIAFPEIGTSVGVDADGNIEGAEIPDDGEILTVSYWKNTENIDSEFMSSIRAMRFKVNLEPFYGYESGEVRFDGMTIGDWGANLTELTFLFTVSLNKTPAQLPTYIDKSNTPFPITGGKKGWEYLWKQTLVSEKGTGVAKVQSSYTNAVYISTFFKLASFSTLPISGDMRTMYDWLLNPVVP